MLKSATLLGVLLSFSRACELDLWVFDSLDHCTSPDAADKIIADGECRSVGLTSPYTFPGYYRATCNGEGIEFSVSGCSDSSCQNCERNPLVGETLYQTANIPIPIQPPLTESPLGKDYRCFSLGRSPAVPINFAFHGTCECPATSLSGPETSVSAPQIPATPVPAPEIPRFPTTPRITPSPTFVRNTPSPILSSVFTGSGPVVYFTPLWSPTPWQGQQVTESPAGSASNPTLAPATNNNSGGSRFFFTLPPHPSPGSESPFSWTTTWTIVNWDAVASSSDKNSAGWSVLGMTIMILVALGM